MTNTTTPARINELDLLRFLAVMAIVFFHYAFRGYAGDQMTVMPYPLLAAPSRYGYLTLELLFMISGFVIAMTALNRSLQHFAISRVVRLYPAFWVCCTLTFAVTLAIGEPRYVATFGQYLVNLTMLAEFVRVPSIDGVYWFLYVEILFYALVGAAVLVGGPRRFEGFLALWLLGELALELLPIGRLPARVLADYSVCFIAGAEFFLIFSKGISPARIVMIAASFGLSILQAINRLPGFEKHYSTTMDRYVVTGIITASFVVMFLVSIRRMGILGRRRWFLAGAISYPLFLLHENIGFMIFNALYPSINPHLLFWGTIVVMIGAACAVHVLIEKRLSFAMNAAVTRLAK
jgi:peptidoglycan/LPS O-acetylase OafA/YrhL